MKPRDLIDIARELTPKESRANFSRAFHLRRINQIVRRTLERAQAWIEYDSTGVNITTGNQSVALPSNMIGDQIIGFEFRETSGDEGLVELDKVDYIDIFAATAVSATPKYFAIHNKTFYINSLADKDYTIYSKYYRTLASDLTEDTVIETTVTPFRLELAVELENFYLSTIDVNIIEFNKVMDEWIDTVMAPAFNRDYITDTNIKSRFDGIWEY